MADNHRIRRITFMSLGLTGCVFVLISLLSYHPTDWPNPDVITAGRTVENLCGPVGALLAYKLNYVFGPSSLLLLAGATMALILHGIGKPIEQLSLRVIGLVLIATVISAACYVIHRDDLASLSQGEGGIIGIAAGHFLLSNTALTGTIVVLLAALLVGTLLAADNLVLLLPQVLWHLIEKLRKSGPILAGVSAAPARLLHRTDRSASSQDIDTTVSPVAVLDPPPAPAVPPNRCGRRSCRAVPG